jgi:WhiB family redox-sensing transcriptional regulator
MRRMSWVEHARCHQQDPDLFFDTRVRAERRAKAICASCLVRVDCLALALQSKAEFGVWGGLTSKERSLLLRQTPVPGDWQEALRTATVPA